MVRAGRINLVVDDSKFIAGFRACRTKLVIFTCRFIDRRPMPPNPERMMEWIKLKRGNSWGQDYYAVEPLDENGFAESSRGVKFADGETCRVRFPDGSEATAIVMHKKRQVSVPDMGRSSLCIFDVPVLQILDRQLVVDYPMDALEIDLEWVKAHSDMRCYPTPTRSE